MSKLTLRTDGETEIIVMRRFAAPPEAVFKAHTDPKLMQQWLLGPEDWTMPSASATRARAASSAVNGPTATVATSI